MTTTPIHQLSDDVLRAIFLFCISLEDDDDEEEVEWYEYPRIDIDAAPILLTRICSRWRNIALSSGDLWNYLFLCLDDPYDADMDRRKGHYATLNRWLALAGNYPLHIVVTEAGEEGAHCDQVNDTFRLRYIEALVSHSRRWKYIVFELYIERLAAFQVLSSEDVPILERFSFTQIYDNGCFQLYDEGPAPLTLSHYPHFCFLESAPRLAIMRLNNIVHPMVLFSSVLHTPLPQLQSLRFGKCSKVDWIIRLPFFYDALRECQTLEYLEFEIYQNWVRPPNYRFPASSISYTYSQPLNLPNLMRLSFIIEELPPSHSQWHGYIDGFSTADLFNMLTLPSLEMLEFKGSSIPEALPALFHLLGRSGPPLYHLDMPFPLEEVGIDTMQVGMLSILRLIPTITHLHFDCSPYRIEGITWIIAKGLEPILTALLHDDTSEGPLCPRLESLQLIDAFVGCASIPDYFISLIESRLSHGVNVNRIKKILVLQSSTRDIYETLEEQQQRMDAQSFAHIVKRWKDAGLDVWIDLGQPASAVVG